MSSQIGTVSSTTGGSGWTNPNNIFTSNNTYAVSGSINNVSVTGNLYALGNGFSIPSSAAIDGMEVSIEAKNALSGAGFRIRSGTNDIFLRYSGADISGSTNPSGAITWSGTSDSTNILGSSSDLWGCTLTPAIVNDASFGIRVRFFNTNASAQTFSVDCIIIKIYYTDGGVSSSQQFFARRF